MMTLPANALPALLALALASFVGPKSAAASEVPELAASSLASVESLARTLEGKRGYALTEQLDDLVLSDEFQRIVDDALVQFIGSENEQIVRATDDYQFDDLFGPVKNPRLRPLAARTYAALTATFELLSDQLLGDAHIDLDVLEMSGQTVAALLTEQSTPVAIRRHLRHIMRGVVALSCLPFVTDDEALRLSLLTHGAIGFETIVRSIAALSAERHAAEILRELRLEPIDFDAIEQRRAQLAEARELLRDIQRDIPSFRIPPDPGFRES